ncbi:MAG: hypothetical protein OMM_03573 [Candidatus Magnetoglobus multicellularis str. Araruama]|uniref:Uncharacterized protein n=1 Tax=Candidatus Magnetoglobus multicellularis str. Araruama TaxID=890399 RepID=A0A1V1P5E3_9BACT|nr:MAG: hypothetical protein OMM_03573 [Candidatus Magnetoglobus multicellularis str. Araruama]
MKESEQEELFIKKGLKIIHNSQNHYLLMRLGGIYKGHPLILRVIAGEIENEPFNGNIEAYWNEISHKIEEVEKTMSEVEIDDTNIIGANDNWQIHKLTLKMQRIVIKQRFQVVFDRLKSQVKDAYMMICASSVYRIPVKEEGWLMQLESLIKHIEKVENSLDERLHQALDELRNRFLIEESFNHNNKRLVGMHNIIRSMALEHHKKLIQQLKKELENK